MSRPALVLVRSRTRRRRWKSRPTLVLVRSRSRSIGRACYGASMTGGFSIGRIFGIPIYLHPTWFLVFVLVTWGLSGHLESIHPDWASGTRLAAAALTSVLFFVSILLHELGHSVLAQRHHVPVRSITLFIFGGVAAIEREPDSPRAELQIALAGPAVSGLLAVAFHGLHALVHEASLTASLLGWLATINGGVAVFNLLPGFPLDGGRVLRAFLWGRTGDAARATRTAARVGQWIAYAFIALGALRALGGDLGGLWTAFIGWFLLSASGSSMQQAAIDDSLRGLHARDVASSEVPRVAPDTSVGDFVRGFVMRGRRFAVVEDAGKAVGLVSLTDVREVAPESWETTRVESVATPIGSIEMARPETSLRDVLRAMATRDVNQIPVANGDHVVSFVSRDAIVQLLELRRAR